MVEIPPFCTEFHDCRTREAREAYVRSELARLRGEGALRLSTLLGQGIDDAASIAIRLLREGAYDDEGREYAPADWAPHLRLLAGAVPPDRDPQGRPMPVGKAGRVLLAKVGQRRFKEGPARLLADRMGREIYETVEVGPVAKPYRLAHAVAILRQWGRGVTSELAHGIVEEVDRDAPAPPVKAGKKAAQVEEAA